MALQFTTTFWSFTREFSPAQRVVADSLGILHLPPFTPHTSPNPARPSNLTRSMNRAFAMHAAGMHVHSLVPGTAIAADLPEDFTAVNARETRTEKLRMS